MLRPSLLFLSVCSLANPLITYGVDGNGVPAIVKVEKRPPPTCTIPAPGSLVLPTAMYEYCDPVDGFPADQILPRLVAGALTLAKSNPQQYNALTAQLASNLYEFDPALEKELLNDIKIFKMKEAAKVVCKIGLAFTPAFDLYQTYDCMEQAQAQYNLCIDRCQRRFPQANEAYELCTLDCEDQVIEDIYTCADYGIISILDPGFLAVIDGVRKFLGYRGLDSYLFPHWYPEEIDPVYLPICPGYQFPATQQD